MNLKLRQAILISYMVWGLLSESAQEKMCLKIS